MLWSLLLVAGLAVGAVYALSGVGLVLLYRATGVMNLAQGALGAFGALLAWQLLQWQQPAALAWSAALAAPVAAALLYGGLVAPRLAGHDAGVQALATMGLALAVLGLANWLWPQNPRRLVLPTDGLAVVLLDVHVTGTRLLAFATALAAGAAVGAMLAFTRTGLAMRALADRRAVAQRLGIPVRRVERIAWAASGALAGASGLLLANLVRLDAATLTFLVIPSLAAAVAGRLRSIAATLAGGLAIGVAEALATLVPVLAPVRAATPFVAALVLLLLWRPAAAGAR